MLYNQKMTTSNNESRKLLASKNASVTNPRLVVLGLLLNENRPLTIEQITKLLEGQIAQSTLYRVINDLINFSLVSEFTTPENTMVVELRNNDQHHHHIFCQSCGSINDIELSSDLENSLSKEVSDIGKQLSITINDHSLELFGICKPCEVRV